MDTLEDMRIDPSLKEVALDQLVDHLLERYCDVPEALGELALPRDLFTEEDVAEEGLKRCPSCNHWVHEDDLEGQSCLLCTM